MLLWVQCWVENDGGPPCSCSFIVQHKYQLCFDSRYATQPDPSGPYAVSYTAKALNHPSSSSELLGLVLAELLRFQLQFNSSP